MLEITGYEHPYFSGDRHFQEGFIMWVRQAPG